jgi:hypothetical protein
MMARIIIMIRNEPRTTRSHIQDTKSEQLPIEVKQVKGLRGRSISSTSLRNRRGEEVRGERRGMMERGCSRHE